MARQRLFMLAFLVLVTTTGFGQVSNIKAQIENALTEKKIALADSLLHTRLNYFFDMGLLDSLPAYSFYVGKVEEKRSNPEMAIRELTQFMDKIKTYSPTTITLVSVYAEVAEYLGSIGRYEQAYLLDKQAYAMAKQVPGIEPTLLGGIDSDMGTFAYRQGNVSLAQYHHRKAIAVFLHSKRPNYESLYTAANNMANQMWLSSKMDSSIYYFNIALDALTRTERTPINQYYRPAVLQNNMSALYNMQGETKKAIDAMKKCIENLRVYLSIPESVPKKPNTISFQFEAIDNLGGIYKELGDYSQALSLENYSYRQKQQYGSDDPSGIFKSQILLGQLYLAMKDHNKALQYLNSGLGNISKTNGDFGFWQADACNSLALLYEEKENRQLAAYFYEKADSLYEASLQGDYDDIYLEFLRNASLFYANNDQLQPALSKANKGFDYVKKTQGAETLLAFYQLLNLSEVYLQAGQYGQSLKYSNQGLAIVNKKVQNSNQLLDSIKTELKKPRAILLRTKAQYHLLTNKNTESLSMILNELNGALSIIERRKSVIHDTKDIGLLMDDQIELLNFTKQITLDLYNLTHDQAYIDRLINLQESGLYSRIRSRLDQSDSIRFAHVSPQVQEKEKQLKAAIRSSLEINTADSKSMSAYFTAVDHWNSFLESVKKQYPEYYKMRYEEIFKSLDYIQQSLLPDASVVRYFFIDRNLFAVVLDREHKQLIELQAQDLDKPIKTVSDYSMGIDSVSIALSYLYNQLWAPLIPYIRNKRIIIIPDGILYDLSFEILTPKRISAYDQLASESLLAKYRLSYHYSLALLGQPVRPAKLDENFIGFAPGFLDDEKKRYLAGIKDSFQLDEGYVTLLPQPFTVNFISKAKELLGGQVYVNSESTASSFRNYAGGHKIIHIGTHAESNNLSPEFSRLIFSKESNSSSNSIFLYEIYNCDLRSELAVLTACESGKPGYQDGEGMISLAHAFNYAGSQSILTGLWKIDEKASMILIDEFYRNLLTGMDKDEALQQAKLHYLQTSKGRMLAPQYWAGLVLMGDTTPIELKKDHSSRSWWIAGITILIALAGFIYYKRH